MELYIEEARHFEMPGFLRDPIRTDKNVHPTWEDLLLHRSFHRCLSCCQAGDRDAAWRTADVVQADLVAEVDGLWIAAVLAADADLQRWSS